MSRRQAFAGDTTLDRDGIAALRRELGQAVERQGLALDPAATTFDLGLLADGELRRNVVAAARKFLDIRRSVTGYLTPDPETRS